MAASLPNPTPPTPGVRDSVLSIPAFRKLWRAMAFSSFGDWLGLLATTALAQQLPKGNYQKHILEKPLLLSYSNLQFFSSLHWVHATNREPD